MLDINTIKIIILFFMLVITFVASMSPLLLIRQFRNVSNEQTKMKYRTVLSLLSCFAGGVFMGTCIMDLFPDVQIQIDTLLQSYPAEARAFPVAEFIVVFGFLLVLTMEQIVLYFKERELESLDPTAAELISSDSHPQQESRHTLQREHSLGGLSDRPDLTGSMRSTVSTIEHEAHMQVNYMPSDDHGHSHNLPADVPHSAMRSMLLLFALSLHSVFEGLAVGLQATIDNVVALFLIVILHKGVIAFSLGLTMVQSNLSVKNIVLSNVIFSVTAPLGVAMGVGISSLGDSPIVALVSGCLQGVACGTFLYVTFFEVLPHEMNSSHCRLSKTVFVILGFATVCGMMYIDPTQKTEGDGGDNQLINVIKLL